jgi:hypothetical protein
MKPKRTSLRTRMPIDHLTASDLLVYPIWEFAIDEEAIEGHDETWIRPVDAQVVRKGLWSLSVAADFRTSAGVLVPGIVAVTTADGVEIDGGVLLPEGKYVFVDASSPASRRSTAKSFGATVKDLFPLTYTLRVLIGREKKLRSGVIE